MIPLHGATLAAASEQLLEFVPDDSFTGAASLSGTMWVERGSGYTIRLQEIGAADRLDYFRKFSDSATDPFASPPNDHPGYITFLMEIVNDGESNLVFQTKNCWLVTDRQEVRVPVGMEDLDATFGMMGHEMAPAYDLAAPAVLAESSMLNPGEDISGLLVYRAVKPKTKRFRVDVAFTSSTGDLVTFSAPYRRPPKEKKKRRR